MTGRSEAGQGERRERRTGKAETNFAWIRTRLAIERTLMSALYAAVMLTIVGIVAFGAVLLRPD